MKFVMEDMPTMLRKAGGEAQGERQQFCAVTLRSHSAEREAHVRTAIPPKYLSNGDLPNRALVFCWQHLR